MSNEQTKNDSESVGEDPKEINIRFLESINLRLADEVTFLRGMVTDLMTDNRLLLSKLIRAPRNLNQSEPADFEPLGGYESLASKIRTAEAEAKRDFEESQNANKK